MEGDIGEGIISRIEEYSQSLADQYGTEPAVINSSLDSDQEESQSGTVEGNAVEENSEAGAVNETEESSS